MDARLAEAPGGGNAPQQQADICFLRFETDEGHLAFEDGSGVLLLEQCPPDVVAPPAGGAGYVHVFTRKRWRELQLALEAEERALLDTKQTRRPKHDKAVQAAIEAANKAILAAAQEEETARLNADLLRLAHALDAAISASRVTASI